MLSQVLVVFASLDVGDTAPGHNPVFIFALSKDCRAGFLCDVLGEQEDS